MTVAQQAADGAEEPVACPECGKADHVQKLSAIPDWPAEYGPPDKPRSIELLDAVLLVLAALWVAVDAAFILAMAMADELEMCVYGLIALPSVPGMVGAPRLGFKRRQRAQWQEAVRRWECLCFCPRDEVAFVPGGTSTIPLDEIRDSLYAELEDSPQEFAAFERELEEAKQKSGTLTCFKCWHRNPVGQTRCEQCGGWVPQTAKERLAYQKDK